MSVRMAGILGCAILLCVSAVEAAEPLVDVAWVRGSIGKPGVVFLDVRGKLAGQSKSDYLRGHIPGSVYTNYLKDGWRTTDKYGTIGQFPGPKKLEPLIGSLGIDNDTHVVIIPAGRKALDMGTATRIYWTFKTLGHDAVSILNGGMAAYIKQVDPKTKKPVNPLETGEVKPQAKTFKANLRKDMIIGKEEVNTAASAGTPLVDHRPNNQYLGVNRHPKAQRNGTIPGAKNLPENWLTVNGGGVFRDQKVLEQLYKAAGVPLTEPQVNFCNTGHWASLGWFVSHELLGNDQAQMYDGSMVEWSADKSLPMETKVQIP